MADWISSKLKAAETLLQQIDQQAAESLRKNEKHAIDDQLVSEASSKAPETKSLIKEQLKMKSTENVISHSIVPSDKRDLNTIRSNSEVNEINKAGVSMNLDSKSNSSAGLTDSDWTELLNIPDKRSGAVIMTKSSNRLPTTRALKKSRNMGNSEQGLNVSMVDGRTDKVRHNGSLKSSKNLNVGLESNISADADDKASIVTLRKSSIQSPTSGGESDQTDSMLTSMFGTENMRRAEEVNDIIDGEKQRLLNDSDNSYLMKSDMKVGSNGGDRIKMAISETNRSKTGFTTSSSKKKLSSLPSQIESNSDTDATSSSDSESEREREERRKRKQQILAEKAAAKVIEAIKEREDLVARLEGEKQSLEKMFEERAKQQGQEASELQNTMMKTMEAVDVEKQKHNNTRMEALARLAKLEGANADLARSLANVQKNLEVEDVINETTQLGMQDVTNRMEGVTAYADHADHIAELRHQNHMKEATHEELRRKISNTHQNGDKIRASKGVEFEMDILEAEYFFLDDKVARMEGQAKTLERSIETTRREIEDPSEVETELKRRLSQLTDHLIQKQAQVETLSSEKAMLLFRTETVSRLLDEHRATGIPGTSSREELEQGGWQLPNILKGRMQSGQQHFGSLVRQLDSLYCTGAIFLRRNSTARTWSLLYLVSLHLWVIYILTSHSPVSQDVRSGAVVSLENINNTGGI